MTAAEPKRVLVVEDDDNIATALEYVIRREGLTQGRIARGDQALDGIRRFHPDLVLLDVMLPEVSGYEICQAMRRDPAFAHVKILMMTARGSALERRRGLDLGADGFLSKPFRMTDLREEVRRLLAPQA